MFRFSIAFGVLLALGEGGWNSDSAATFGVEQRRPRVVVTSREMLDTVVRLTDERADVRLLLPEEADRSGYRRLNAHVGSLPAFDLAVYQGATLGEHEAFWLDRLHLQQPRMRIADVSYGERRYCPCQKRRILLNNLHRELTRLLPDAKKHLDSKLAASLDALADPADMFASSLERR